MTVAYLVDTCVVSEATRRQGDERVLAWLERHDADLYLSVIAIGELRFGMERLPAGKRKQDIARWLRSLETRFRDRILDVDTAVVQAWADARSARERAGRPLVTADGLIAATALHHGFVLVTRNVDDFSGLELEVIDPWSAEG